MTSNYKYRLLTPGPVPITEDVQKALSAEMIHHRTEAFKNIFEKTLSGLQSVFGTEQPVLIHTATGSGAMESAIVNCLSPGDKVLVVESGKFGQRWSKIARAYGVKVIAIKVEWGRAVDVKEVQKTIAAHPDYKALLCQACETSTGTLHPIKKIAPLVANNDSAVFIVDAITALGATAINMDEWQLDVVVGGSQKAFMMPAGLSFISLSEKAWKLNQSSTCPKFYFDLLAEKKANANQQTTFSSAVSHIKALHSSLKQMSKEALPQLIQRCENLALATRKAGQVLGLEVFSAHPSSSVTALLVPKNVDGQEWIKRIETEFNITVAGGQDHLKGKIIRIGHLGAITNEDMRVALTALSKTLRQLSQDHHSEQQLSQALTTLGKYLDKS